MFLQPLLSVIVPVYNVEDYLEECIQSIINQDYKFLDIIIVDDGSTDSSPIIAEKYAKLDNRIKVYSKPNGGLSDARNYGLDRAQGEYITFIDSDDVLIGKKIYSTVIHQMEDNPELDFIQYDTIHKWHSKNEYRRNYPFKQYTGIENILRGYLMQDIHVACWDKIYKRKVFDNIRFPKGEISEDIAIIPQIVEVVNRIEAVNIGYYGYRYREGSITTGRLSFSKAYSMLKSNYKYYKFAYKYKSLRNLVITQYGMRLWNAISLALQTDEVSYNEIKNANLYFRIPIWKSLKYTSGLPIKERIKCVVSASFRPYTIKIMQHIFTKK